MGSTYVTITDNPSGPEPGFWMNDGILELWLRLLALHLPEPTDDGQYTATVEIRNQWLLASRGYFGGCVPHNLETACSTPEGRQVVKVAIDSVLGALLSSDSALDADTLNLLGFINVTYSSIERWRLRDVAYAFLDLIDGKINATAESTEIMPGAKCYERPAS